MWLLLLFASALWAGDAPPEKPACAAATRGQMWPPEANRDPKEANRLAREGLLEICNRGPWKYHWSSPSVHIRQLTEQRSRKAKQEPVARR